MEAQKVQSLAMNANKNQDSAATMSLGPGYRGWGGKGSGSAPKPQQANRFSAIQNSDAEGPRRNFSASMGNFNRSSHSRGSSVDPDRAGALEAAKQFSSSAVTSSNGPMTGGPKEAKNDRSGGHAASRDQTQVAGGPSMSMGHMAHMQAPSTLDESKLMAEQTKVLKGPQDLNDDLLKRRTKGKYFENRIRTPNFWPFLLFEFSRAIQRYF